MEQFNEIINFLFNKKNYTTVLMFVIAIFAVFFFSGQYTIPKYQEWQNEIADIEAKQQEFDTLKQQKEAREREARKNSMKIEEVPVKIYKSEQAGLPIESTSVEFVSNILKMLESTHNSILDISYQIDALLDTDKNTVPSNVSVVQLVMTLNGTYSSFMDFIATLYNYDYLTSIKSIRALPLKENKNILEMNVVIWLYVEKT